MSYTYTFVCFTNRIYYGNLLLNDEYKSWPKKVFLFFLLAQGLWTFNIDICPWAMSLRMKFTFPIINSEHEQKYSLPWGVRTTDNSSIVYWNLRIWRENKKTTEKNRHPCLWQRDRFSAIKKLINIPNVQRSVKTSENSF